MSGQANESGALRRIIPGVGLGLILLLAAWLRFSRLGQFDNEYYTATVATMLGGWHNFLFASFDPGGVVSVDKPPVAFWLDSIPASLLGVSGFSVSLVHALAGLASVALLYALIRPVWGRPTALMAALALAVIPVAVSMDSRNEPDSILSFELLLATFCVVRAVERRRFGWLLAAAIVIGIGFNTKMGAALVPVPAFMAYYALASARRWRARIWHLALAVSVMVAVSLSWVGMVAATPPDKRPYVGSTQDNSIWTLVVEYNGLNRFTSFIGPRRPVQQGTPMPAQGQPLPGVPLAPQGTPLPGTIGPAVPPQTPTIADLFTTPLAAQLGGLLLLAVWGLALAGARFVPMGVYRHPGAWLGLVRSPAPGRLLLWGGWLVTGILVFGLAPSTRTHPYYLSQLAVPGAAVLALGLGAGWRRFRHRARLAWALPGALVIVGAYQLYLFRDAVSGWTQAGAILVLAGAAAALLLALLQKATDTPLAKAAAVAGCLALLLVPLAMSIGRTVPVMGGQAPSGAPAPQPGERPRVDAVARFITSQGDIGGVFAVGVVRASEAAPFIIRGIPALAIGGFSGNDPVFRQPGSFQEMVTAGKLRYFLMPGTAVGTPQNAQRAILDYIRLTWQDVSLAARLPAGTLYRYRP